MQEGTSALVQMRIVAAAIAAARKSGVPFAAVAGDPTTGGVWASLVAAADVVITAARRPGRPKADRWLAGFDNRFEIRGDRAGGVDTGLRCGFGSYHRQTFGYIAQLGKPTTAAGFRAAIRLIGLAERFSCPILTLIDTPGAASAPGDEADGVGTAIAELLVAVASCTVPITSVVIGDGVSGGAIALCSPDDSWISPDGYLAVAAPEMATSILKRERSEAAAIADLLRLTPADLTARDIVRGVVTPPVRTARRESARRRRAG